MTGTNVRDVFIKIGVVAILIAILCAGVYWLLNDRGIIGSAHEQPCSTVFILGPGMNSRTINFDDNPELSARIDRVVNTYGFAAIVVADGNPASQTRVFDFSVFRPSAAERIIEDDAIKETLVRVRSHFFDEMKNAHSQAPERDLVEALSIAARILSSRPSDEIREIVVLSTGLSTAGFLNFTDDNAWLYSDAIEIIDTMQSNGSLPNLNGITVSWFQMHDVCGVEQEVIPGTQRQNLEEIWRLFVARSGGEFIIVEEHPGRGIYEGLPHVTPVEILSAITGVIVHPEQADVQRGTSYDFSALVAGYGITAQDVEWSIDDSSHPETVIDDNGRLIVAPNDPRESIVIIAVSTADPRVSGRATVRLREESLSEAVVREITIFPDDIILGTASPYNVFDINAMVLGDNNPSQAVRFELTGNNDPGTRVDSNGRIIIGSSETSFILIIRVTSLLDPSIYAEVPVRVFAEAPDTVEVMFVGDSSDFICEEQARNTAGEWVEFIDSQDRGIYLFGCTAHTGNDYLDSVSLGLERAEAFKELLVREFGIDPSRIITMGLGYNNPWNRPNGIRGTPSWNAAVAATNRRVVIMSADDDFAISIYNGTWR